MTKHLDQRNIPLLLTATVDPKGMVGAAFQPEERAQQYAEAVAFYLRALPQRVRIVFAENSGAVELVARHFPPSESRVEWLDVEHPHLAPSYDQSRGKGYNEWLLMREAVMRSEVIAEAGCFFKVTGRLKVLNIASLLAEVERRGIVSFLGDCKDHTVYEWLHMPINGHVGECRYFYASREFFLESIFPGYSQMDDYAHPPRLAEDCMLGVCRKARRMEGAADRFRTQARISGKGGHALGQGASFFYSTDNDSAALRLKCLLRQLLRWVMPWWRC